MVGCNTVEHDCVGCKQILDASARSDRKREPSFTRLRWRSASGFDSLCKGWPPRVLERLWDNAHALIEPSPYVHIGR